ncbi:uncharacterized protein HMPREF1541_06143 [Cyphellophora europaea CBS 101466]|uniref:NAD(P)-binding protein n=1 Tax=Cyphellophora europaea (strain CBS 101466) TaxID=1220924 RepID=W2RTV3_CYPE1|nr:uncharacterized protein HMPREF1541_06143 [Cyphellophora europaea CBS 101466]ETN39916.1 hypothetical protein HMPREF1541_06143 [Cyphellophora europaea CBS 101466]
MTATTNADFDATTEANEVAAAFPEAIKGKTILITGVNVAGIGFSTAEALASQGPKALILSGRTFSKLQESITKLQQAFPTVTHRALVIDLASQASVRAAAAEVLSWPDIPSIDILINNAGIMNVPERTLSPDGIESHFATNHLGHFLLTNLLMPRLLAAAETNPTRGATRIINVSSSAMRDGGVRFSDINYTRPQNQLPEDERHLVATLQAVNGSFDPDTDIYVPPSAYAQSKSANVLFSVALTRRLYRQYGILSVSLHPGAILTELVRYFTPERMERVHGFVKQGFFAWKSRGQGAATALVAALDPALGEIEDRAGREGWGAYLEDCQISEAPGWAVGAEQAERLWDLSEELVGERFGW